MERLIRPFSLLPVQVLPCESEGPWIVEYDIKTSELYGILYMEPRPQDKGISFSEGYKLRWMEQARQDSQGKWWLMNGRSIRTPLHIWAKDRGYYVYFLPSEITFPEPINLPF